MKKGKIFQGMEYMGLIGVTLSLAYVGVTADYSTLTKNTGDTLTAASWNQLVDNVRGIQTHENGNVSIGRAQTDGVFDILKNDTVDRGLYVIADVIEDGSANNFGGYIKSDITDDIATNYGMYVRAKPAGIVSNNRAIHSVAEPKNGSQVTTNRAVAGIVNTESGSIVGQNQAGYFVASPEVGSTINTGNYGVYALADPRGEVNGNNIAIRGAVSIDQGTINGSNVGVYGSANTSAGSTVSNNNAGGYFIARPAAPVGSDNFAVYGSTSIASGGNIGGNNFGARFVSSPEAGSTIVGNNYGLSLSAVPIVGSNIGGDNYGIYVNVAKHGVAGITYGLFQSASDAVDGEVVNYIENYTGFGKNDPKAHVDVNGNIKISQDNTVCNGDYAGSIKFSGGQFQGCTGSVWVNLH